MAIIINEGFDVNSPYTIDKRLIVDRVDGTTASLVSLIPQYNYVNMYVWVKEEKAFYYLNNTVNDNGNPGATVSDWTKLLSGSGGSASAIDLSEVAFGTGTGITSSNNFTWNNTCNNLIASKSSNITNGSCESAIIGGVSNDIINSDSSLISGYSNNIYSSPRSSIIGGGGNSIGTQSQIVKQPSNNSRNVIIGGSSNEISGSSSYNSSIIGGYTSYIKESKQSVILGGIGLTLSNESNVVYVPELKIATASNSSTTDKVLVWDTTDNYVKWRSDSSLGLAKNAKKVAWENDNSYPTMPGQTQSWGLTAGLDPNTVIFYNGNNSFDSPQGDIVVSLNPATATPGLNRDFKLILGNFGRVETGNTWSVAYNGTRLVEYGVGRVEPHVLDFSWATSSGEPNGEYLLTKYMLELPTDDFKTTGLAYGRDFTSVKRMMGFYGVVNDEGNIGGSNVFPKGSIIFANEAFVYCEAQTTTASGVTISFGLNKPPNNNSGSYGTAITSWEPSLSSFGVSTSGSILFPPKSLGDFATGSIYYSKSQVGIIRLNEPAMIVLTVAGGVVKGGTLLKLMVPYIVDEASSNAISGTNYISGPGIATGATGCAKSGFVSGSSFAGTGTSSASVVFSTPYSSASYSVVVTSQAFTTTDYVYSVTDKTAAGFIIRTPSTGPIGATAMWITNCYDGSGLSSGGSGGNATFLPLPVPKINLMQYTQQVDVYNSSTNGVFATQALIANYPVLINMDFTSDHFSNPNNKIFIEMVHYKRKSRSRSNGGPYKNKGKSYMVPAKNLAGVGQDSDLPWINAASMLGATGSWTRSGNSSWFNGSVSVPIGIDRPNHLEVTSYNISSYPIWQYFNGRFEFYDVAYRDITGATLSINTLIPSSGKSKAGRNKPTNRYAYSPYYTPYYCAFRYIQWIPNVNPRPGGGYYGQIVSGPLSKVIKVTGLNFPFQTNYQQSAVLGFPVCDISIQWTSMPTDSYQWLKCDWESNLP